MRTRQFGGPLVLATVLLLASAGHELNGGSPSIPWSIAGLTAGVLAVAAIRGHRGV
ncbi:hypothetical protein [Streptomyces sp. NPDC001889]